MSTSHAFKAGWQDKLLAMPTPAKYERCRTGIALAYERGRHCAALWEYEWSRRTGTITCDGKLPSFAKAYKAMSKELRALIRAEKKFCALKPAKWSV